MRNILVALLGLVSFASYAQDSVYNTVGVVKKDPQRCIKSGPKISKIESDTLKGILANEFEMGMYFWVFYPAGTKYKIVLTDTGDEAMTARLNKLVDKNPKHEFAVSSEFAYFKNKKDGIDLTNCADATIAARK